MDLQDKVQKLDPQTEFETKYKTSADVLSEFKDIAEKLPKLKNFLYVEGPDYYYVNPNIGSAIAFARYRRASHSKDGGTLTFKEKTSDKNNIVRYEDNLDLAKHVTKEQVEATVNRLGYEFNFKITKMCHIYKYEDATLVFYSVRDKDKKEAHFLEIEVDEDTIGNLTEDDAWLIVKKYEAALGPIGVIAQKRLRLSLFEMYSVKQPAKTGETSE